MKLFADIESVIADRVRYPGWCELPKAVTLVSAIMALRPAVTVEIGVFGGSSLIPMALAHREIGIGTVIGIDPWSSVAASEGYTGDHLIWWGKTVDLEKVYQEFMQRIAELQLTNCVQIVRSTSDAFTPPQTIDLLHIDGQHSDQAVRDVERYASRVRVGGMVFSDDINWVGGGVLRSVAKLKTMGFRELYRAGTGGMFQRI